MVLSALFLWQIFVRPLAGDFLQTPHANPSHLLCELFNRCLWVSFRLSVLVVGSHSSTDNDTLYCCWGCVPHQQELKIQLLVLHLRGHDSSHCMAAPNNSGTESSARGVHSFVQVTRTYIRRQGGSVQHQSL